MDSLEAVRQHAQAMGWVARGCYLRDRGWFVGSDHGWVSPHDGSIHDDSVTGVIEEMMRELEGNPTPRSGRYIDPVRGETKRKVE
jgi:hypothetical protein